MDKGTASTGLVAEKDLVGAAQALSCNGSDILQNYVEYAL